MMRHFAVLIAASLVCACSPSPSAEQKAKADARAVAQVEQMRTVPALALSPEEITYADIEKHDLFGAGCYFLDGVGDKPPMLFLASDESRYITGAALPVDAGAVAKF